MKGGAYFVYQLLTSKSRRLGAKFYVELNKVKQLCVNMDISIKEMRSKPVRLGKDIMFILFNNVKLPSTETHFFSRGRGRVLILRRRLLQILSLRRGANSKQALISSWALIRTFTASY